MLREKASGLCKKCRAGARAFMEDERAQMNFLNGGIGINEITGTTDDGSQFPAFSRDFNVSNFDSFGGTVTDGKFVEIARFKVPADTEYAWGYGTAKNPENQGYLYVDLKDDSSTPVEVDGTLRLKVESSTGRRTEVVKDLDTETLDASKTDRTKRTPLPEQVNSAVATQDAFLVVELDPVSADDGSTVSGPNSDVILPVTEYDKS